MIKCGLPLLIIATCIVGIFADEFCEKQRKLDSECSKYCYQVAKPLLQMAPVCHQKDAAITELNIKIADMQNELVVYKERDRKSLEEGNKYNELNEKFNELNKKLGVYEEREKKTLEEGTKCNELSIKLTDLQNKLVVYGEREGKSLEERTKCNELNSKLDDLHDKLVVYGERKRKSKEEENKYNELNDKFIELNRKLALYEYRERKSLEKGTKFNNLITKLTDLQHKLVVYEERERKSLEEVNKYNELNEKFNELNKNLGVYEERERKSFEEGNKCNALNEKLDKQLGILLNFEDREKKGMEEMNKSKKFNEQLGKVQEKLADCEEREKKGKEEINLNKKVHVQLGEVQEKLGNCEERENKRKENNSKSEGSLQASLEEYRVKLSNFEKAKENCTIYASRGVDTQRFIEIEGMEAFSVRCVNDLSSGPGWMLIQKRIESNDENDFYLTWSTYRSGFKYDNGGFFIGLEKLYRLTNAEPHELYIDMEDYDGNKKFAHYDNFRVGNESDQYPLKDLGNYTPDSNAGDALRDNNNMKFSTFDRDNDNSPVIHCAEKYDSAWWHNNCTKANLNGIQIGRKAYFEPSIWWLSPEVTLKNVRMLIRPKVKK